MIEEKWDQNTPSKFSKSTWHKIKIRERKGSSRGILQKCEPQEHSPCASKFEERSHEETLHQEGCARRVARNLSKSLEAQECGPSYAEYSYWSNDNAGTHFEKTGRARIRCRFWSINAHAEQEMFKLRWTGYFAKIQHPYCGIDCQWRSAHPRGGTSVRSWSKSIRDSAITRRNTGYQRGEDNCMQNGQLHT